MLCLLFCFTSNSILASEAKHLQYGHQAFEKREFLKALHHFQEATNYHKTTGEGFFWIGHMMEKGLLFSKDLDGALKKYRQSANAGYFDSQVRLARFYRGGLGIRRDPVRALMWYVIAITNPNIVEPWKKDLALWRKRKLEKTLPSLSVLKASEMATKCIEKEFTFCK